MENNNYLLGILGGMGPKATNYFYDLLIDKTNASCDQEHINSIILSHATMPDRTSYILDNTKDNPYPLLLNDIKLLENLGVKMIIIPCNTCTYFYDKLKENTNVILRNMITDTVNYIKNNNYKNVCIMATKGTIESRLYQTKLEEYNINYVIANTDKVMNIIYNYIKKGKKVSKELFNDVVKDIKADIFILGCTELSTLKKDLELNDKFIDPLIIEADIAVKYFNKERN